MTADRIDALTRDRIDALTGSRIAAVTVDRTIPWLDTWPQIEKVFRDVTWSQIEKLFRDWYTAPPGPALDINSVFPHTPQHLPTAPGRKWRRTSIHCH